ncbi:hypothetical protein ARMGADRAFT_1013524 [Armillaria gallica]|uniref:Peptidase C14 caspase domain-containing protein n=1 Tax=Armillaria gallica TaxID=47427 RepID=A0A2H3DT83_ARMGA|nr:hypothetical protein ARMGADRAFT_1013524 [Armillaria gallica]
MEKYFVEDLAVPEERIQRLLGPKNNYDTSALETYSIPSRENILSVLHSLIDNDKIGDDDPIIIFVAGHGLRYLVSYEDSDSDHEHDCESPLKYMEALCPIDRGTPGSNDNPIPDISDWELNTIFSVLSRAKGHRITVLLDCCHAGSITRTYSGEQTAPLPNDTSLQDMLSAGEKGLTKLLGCETVFSEDWVPDMDSHVVIAACREEERANSWHQKKDGTKVARGVFTSLLIETLRSNVLKEGATYVNLVKAVCKALRRHQLRCRYQLQTQTPNVAGRRQDMRLWYQD